MREKKQDKPDGRNMPSFKSINFTVSISSVGEGHWNYGRVVPIKTQTMIDYERKTGKNSIRRYIEKPNLREMSNGEIRSGRIQLTKGYLKWLKNRRRS